MFKITKYFICFGLLLAAIILDVLGPNPLRMAGLTEQSPYWSNLIIGLEVFLWVAATLVVCLLVRVLVWDGLVKRATGWSTPGLIKQLSDIVIILIAALIGASVIFDQNVVAFVTALGAVGVVLSFGIKELISDLMTGLAINIENSFSIGDWVSINDGQAGTIFGRVTQIHWRTTHLIDDNQSYFVVPNREIGNSTVTVYSSPTPHYRFSIPVDLDYTLSVPEAKRILMAAVLAVTKKPYFLETPQPTIIVESYPANGVRYLVRFWLDMSGDVAVQNAKSIVMESVLHHLRLSDMSPCFNKIELFKVDPPDMIGVPPVLEPQKIMAHMPFLQPLNAQERDYLVEQSRTVFWSPKQTVIAQGDDGDSMFVVLEGTLDVTIDIGNGTQKHVAHIEAGEMFGEMSLLTGEPRSATISAMTRVKTLEITKNSFAKLLVDRPKLGEILSDIMTERQMESESAISSQQREEVRKHTFSQLYSKVQDFFNIKD